MSIQSDTEFLAIQAVEFYAREKHLSNETVVELFHDYQIFEKILLQHEYLHQLDMGEVMEYVNNLLEEKSRKLFLFHGTNKFFDEIDLTKSNNRRDFGRGFYTTVLEKQARQWAYRLSLREYSLEYFVYQFEFEEVDYLRVKRFDSLCIEWLDFIKENRAKGGLQHEYDVIIGPVADDNTMETVQLYIAGILTDKEAVERLRYSKVNNQVSFHTQKALENLKFMGRTRYE